MTRRTSKGSCPFLTAGLPSGRLPLGLRAGDAYRVPGGRDAAVGAGLHNGLGSAFKFRDLGFEFLYLLVLADKIMVQDINGKSLLMKFLRELRGVEILGVTYFPKELPAPAGESHQVRFDALSKSCIEVLFHATKVMERFGTYKFNRLSIKVLNAIF